MSSASVIELESAFARDENLRAKLAEATTAEDVVRIAGDSGFSITLDDVSRARGELSEADLDAVAGGASVASLRSVASGSLTNSGGWCTYGCSMSFEE
jgi:predicted ribosomally synthesized peptide with nif11-like leader